MITERRSPSKKLYLDHCKVHMSGAGFVCTEQLRNCSVGGQVLTLKEYLEVIIRYHLIWYVSASFQGRCWNGWGRECVIDF